MADATRTETLALELAGIDKSFYGTHANAGVDFNLRHGEVHALLGENGAGKSTLCSIIAGLYRPDAGTIHRDGRPVQFRSPRDAFSAGIGMVYQHFRLVPNLTVAENLVLGTPGPFRLSRRVIEEQARRIGEHYGLEVDPTTFVWQLSVGQQQRVEILKMLHREARILILDEPTAVLTPQEADALFATCRQMAGEGRSVILVSHKLREIEQSADRVTVLRDGRVVGHGIDIGEVTPRSLARLMVGRDLAPPQRRDRSSAGEVVLAARDLRMVDDRGLEALRGVTFALHAGEVLGVAGVAGNGQHELALGLTGLRQPSGGTVELNGQDVTRMTVSGRIGQGLVYVPQRRLGVGLAPGLTTPDNMALKSVHGPDFSRGPLLNRKAIDRHATRLIDSYDVRGVRPGLPIRLLSGGNLQKALLAREMTLEHTAIVAHSPTRGLDVGATEAVRRNILAERDRGVGVLLITEDLDELLALSDHILVLFEGRVAGTMPVAESDVEQLGLLMAGHTGAEHGDRAPEQP